MKVWLPSTLAPRKIWCTPLYLRRSCPTRDNPVRASVPKSGGKKSGDCSALRLNEVTRVARLWSGVYVYKQQYLNKLGGMNPTRAAANELTVEVIPLWCGRGSAFWGKCFLRPLYSAVRVPLFGQKVSYPFHRLSTMLRYGLESPVIIRI